MKKIKRIVALALMALSLFAIALPAMAATPSCKHTTYGSRDSTLEKLTLLGRYSNKNDSEHWITEKWKYLCIFCPETRQDASPIEVPGTRKPHDKYDKVNFHHAKADGVSRDVKHTKIQACRGCSWETPSYNQTYNCYGCNAPLKRPYAHSQYIGEGSAPYAVPSNAKQLTGTAVQFPDPYDSALKTRQMNARVNVYCEPGSSGGTYTVKLWTKLEGQNTYSVNPNDGTQTVTATPGGVKSVTVSHNLFGTSPQQYVVDSYVTVTLNGAFVYSGNYATVSFDVGG